jgi:uncharacterized protein (TIGR00251 family)
MGERAERVISLRVQPRSSRSGVALGSDGGLVVRVHAPAAEGAANQELIRVLAEALRAPRSAVQIVRGERSRTKQIAVSGLSAEEVRALLERRARGEAKR